MIYAIDRDNRFAFRRYLDTLGLRDDLRGSDGPIVHGSAYGEDTDETVYLLSIDDFGNLSTGMQLRRAPKQQLFAAHVEEGVFAATCRVIGPEQSENPREGNTGIEILVAMMEYGLASGLTHISLLGFLSAPFAVEPESLFSQQTRSAPEESASDILLLELSLEAADRLRQMQNVRGPVLTYRATPPPYSANDNGWLRLVQSSQD